MNDVIRGKIIHVAKMATKDESSVEVDFAVCSYKKECFYFNYQEEYFLFTMSLWVCYRNSNKSFRAKIFLDRCYREQTRADLNAKKKNAN